jgi:hypothetical protein
MKPAEAIEKARGFANTAYVAASEDIIRQSQDEMDAMRGKLAARGNFLSGQMIVETARIMGKQIRALAQARLNAILEGYDLCDVSIDDAMATDMCYDIMGEVDQIAGKEARRAFPGMSPNAAAQYPNLLAQNLGASVAWARTQIDRRRLMSKKSEGTSSTTIYNVRGDNARWNINSTDNSLNVITESTGGFFTAVRQRIETGVSDPEKRLNILGALSELEKSHGKASFAQRYTDFISAAADYVALLTHSFLL